MGLRINTNVPAIAARNRLGESADRASHAIKALATGNRFVNAGDDAADFAIAENLKGHMEGMLQAQRNAGNAIGFVQVGEGGLNEQNNILVRMRELSIQAASDTVSDDERGFLDKEFQQLSQEFDRIAKTTTFGSRKLLTGVTAEFDFQVGTNAGEENVIHYKLEADTQANAMGIDGMGITDKGDAKDTLQAIDEAMVKLAGVRSDFGSIQSRLQFAESNLGTQYENLASAHSRLADADIAYEAGELAHANILQEMGIAVAAQANSIPSRASRLINGI